MTYQADMRRAFELLTVAKVTNAEFRTVQVDTFETRIHLEPDALYRVLQQFEVPRSKIEITKLQHHLHISFKARRVTWVGLLKIEDAVKWKGDALPSSSGPALPAPALLRLEHR